MSSLFCFLEAHVLYFFHYSSRHSLYLLWRPEASGPPQQDAATVGARNWVLFYKSQPKSIFVALSILWALCEITFHEDSQSFTNLFKSQPKSILCGFEYSLSALWNNFSRRFTKILRVSRIYLNQNQIVFRVALSVLWALCEIVN